jgi:hypothetical protein
LLLQYAKESRADPSKQGTYNLVTNNCATFSEDVLEAGGEELDVSLINTPSNVMQELQDVADFYFGYDFEIDVLEIDCDGKNCP